mmetsp:Transcript_6476/g.25947  ORF Transcript_6476/g.25947 Transcript_6476/m.25947 type:complete len:200 (-) Transcript_6476:1359-1958(-)
MQRVAPERRRFRVQTKRFDRLDEVLRAAGSQEIEKLRFKALRLLHVRAVQRADQEITECISVDVEGDVVEVRDVRVKVRSVFERVEDFTLLAVILFRALAPRLGHFLRRHRTLGAHGVHLFFKFIKRALTHDGVDDVVHLGHDHRQTIFIARSLLQQVTEHNHFSKDARGFRERERRVELQDALRVTQLKMDCVPRLVR